MKKAFLAAWVHVAWPISIAQYILGFFVYNLPGWPPLQAVGWGVWVVSVIFGIAPIFLLGRRGGGARGKSCVETTHLVDTSLYAVVRHPQYLAGILFNISMMLLAQHWLVIVLGAISAAILYFDIQAADRQGIEKFGDEYRRYVRRVPQINIPLGLLRLWRAKRTRPEGQRPQESGS
jgi:protein-S-isoprenylcysteine O-methyltransferase Ste14